MFLDRRTAPGPTLTATLPPSPHVHCLFRAVHAAVLHRCASQAAPAQKRTASALHNFSVTLNVQWDRPGRPYAGNFTLTAIPWFRMAMLAIRGDTYIEVVYHHHNVDIIVAHLGWPSGKPYRILFLDVGPQEIRLHHVGPCNAIQPGPNTSVSLESIEFFALGLLSASPRLDDSHLQELCPSGYLCIDTSELWLADVWRSFEPFHCAVSRFQACEMCVWFIWTSKARQTSATSRIPPGCHTIYSNCGHGGKGAVTVVKVPVHMWPGNRMTFQRLSSASPFQRLYFCTE